MSLSFPLRRQSGPPYLQIVDAIERRIGDGSLAPGDRLPTQRELAAQLGVDLTTVSRAYSLCKRRGLIDARGVRGSFVAHPQLRLDHVLDLSLNLPPPPAGIDIGEQLRTGMAKLLARSFGTFDALWGATDDELLALPDVGPATTASIRGAFTDPHFGEEVRKLAEDSNKSAESIRGLVNTIQEETSVTVHTMETNLERVDTQVGAIETGGRFIGGIVAEISLIEKLVAELSTQLTTIQANARNTLGSVEEISAVAQQSAAGAEEMSAATEEQSATAQEVSAGAHETSAIANNLKLAVERFRV